ncbi:HNH endonuclease [Hymenobacter lapidiphilus]|nr:HNH endonuclease [Hymenobacter sp. CCM 8763]
MEQRELTEQEKTQVFQRDNYTCLCCGKQKGPGRRVTLQVDHILPFKYGGETSLSNSQTLCSVCNNDKGVNEINFRVHTSPLSAPKPRLETQIASRGGYIYVDEELTRIVNMYYHCRAVAEVKCTLEGKGSYRRQWQIHLFEGNNPTWLAAHSNQLLAFAREQMNCRLVEEILVL